MRRRAESIGAALAIESSRGCDQGGCEGLPPKTTPTDQIVEAVRRIASGGVAFLSEADATDVVAAPDLARREQEIVSRPVLGRTNKEIAAELSLSAKTVEWYLSRLFQKLGVESRTELVANAQRDGWVDSSLAGRA